jgi:hypothetical protein
VKYGLISLIVVLLAAAIVARGASAHSSVATLSSRVDHLKTLVHGDVHTVWWLRHRAPHTRERPRILRNRQRALRWHRGLLTTAQSHLGQARTPQTWLDAVELVGQFYGQPMRDWERSCSARGSEGGWGRWVSNTQGSGAGGWLQFMSGTFYGVIDKAITGARSRGMYVPASAGSWYSPLGQAIAGAQMILDGRRGEWTGYGC